MFSQMGIWFDQTVCSGYFEDSCGLYPAMIESCRADDPIYLQVPAKPLTCWIWIASSVMILGASGVLLSRCRHKTTVEQERAMDR